MTLLLQAHATMTAATTLASATTVTEKFEKKEHFFPAQKNEIQLRFKQTIAKPGRKKQTVPLRYIKSLLYHGNKMEFFQTTK